MSNRKRQTMIHKTLHRKRSLKTSLITLLIILSYASDAYCHSYRSIHLAARLFQYLSWHFSRDIFTKWLDKIYWVYSSSSSVGIRLIIECMWFRENFAHDKIIQYLQIKLCTWVYGLLRGDCLDDRLESFHHVSSCYVGGQLIPIPDGPGETIL